MALIVETGLIVENANSYASLETIKSYAAARGVTLGTDPIIEQQAIIAVDYIDSFRSKFQGGKVSQLQTLQFPRYSVFVDEFEIAETSIPIELVKAQCQLVCEQAKGVSVMATQTEPVIKKEVIGPIETEYAVSNGSISDPIITSVNVLLEPLFRKAGFGLTVVRI